MRVKSVTSGKVYLDYKSSRWKYNINIQFYNQNPSQLFVVDSAVDYSGPFETKRAMREHVSRLLKYHGLDNSPCLSAASLEVVRIH